MDNGWHKEPRMEGRSLLQRLFSNSWGEGGWKELRKEKPEESQRDKRPFFVRAREQISNLLSLISTLLWLASFVTLLYQSALWLKHGHWIGLPLSEVLEESSSFRSWDWIHNPDSWLGMHKIAMYLLDTSLALSFALAALLFLWARLAVEPLYWEHEEV